MLPRAQSSSRSIAAVREAGRLRCVGTPIITPRGPAISIKAGLRPFRFEEDEHLLTVLRYVERNPLRADLCERAEDWRWGSMWRRQHAAEFDSNFLAPWPLDRPRQ